MATLIFSYMYICTYLWLGPFLGFKIQYLWGVSDKYFLGYDDFVDILGGVITHFWTNLGGHFCTFEGVWYRMGIFF